jgi:hypothetical protein
MTVENFEEAKKKIKGLIDRICDLEDTLWALETAVFCNEHKVFCKTDINAMIKTECGKLKPFWPRRTIGKERVL